MYAITGITGKVGGALARTLLSEGKPVRAVLRNQDKAREWAQRGCDVALAKMDDVASLTAAFKGADSVFILPPSEFAPLPGFPEARAVIDVVKTALESARPAKVVCLSTIGAQATRTNLLSQRTLMEEALAGLNIPVTFLRPAWFMENFAWDVESARQEGVIHSFLQPLDKPVPMIATRDVGRIAAELIQQNWQGCRAVELEATKRISPNEIAATFAKVLDRPVTAQIVPRETWEELFTSQGMKNPIPRMLMLDGFNEGWIEFEGNPSRILRGDTELETVLREVAVG
ncbi:NmrA family NAD(P)-binding protein [Dyella acidisoli]|uniref:Nucleoside-diphosphate sugar epimerase n=1 Tax=Dyella acidisoli TaxID=1867834 RepID=A0ABQ5XT26_9GAMM|nr:NmrA family NAD(P)-binding protein [Dyella acidisoli]GLQ93484.1 nucleoside-diphosphate sugar epimerase [Dyella acidisoli]